MRGAQIPSHARARTAVHGSAHLVGWPCRGIVAGQAGPKTPACTQESETRANPHERALWSIPIKSED